MKLSSSIFSLLWASNCIYSIDAFSGSSSRLFVTPNQLSSRATAYPANALEKRQNNVARSMTMPNGIDEINAITSSSSMILSDFGEKMGGATKTIAIILFSAGGLIPAAIAANKSMMSTLTGGKKIQTPGNPETSLDPTAASVKTYIESSGATGPTLSNSGLIFASEEIPVADIIAITGRMTDVNSIAKWADLPSTKVSGLINTENPPMWLPRVTFKENIRKARFTSWPVDPESGLPVGGEELKKAEEARIRKNGASIGDAALDAVFDTWAWGAGIATPDKVETQLNAWRVGDTLNLRKLTNAAIRGRATTGIAAFSFITIQVIAYGTLFIAPALRYFFDIDIGFGVLGDCSEAGCKSLF